MPSPSFKPTLGWTFRGAVAAVSLAVPLILLIAFGDAPDEDLRRSILRLGAPDALEGRLSESIGLTPAAGGEAETGELRRRLRSRLARLGDADQQVEAAWSRGLIALFDGRLEAAQAGFRSAALRADDWRSWNDLAVTSIERASREDRPLDYLRALTAARRAVDLAPDRAETRFNWALALSKLHLRQTEARAWRELLEVAVGSGEELQGETEFARERLERLARPTRRQRFEERAAALDEPMRASGSSPPEELAREFPDLARIYAERRLAKLWSGAVLAGDVATADRAQALGARIGTVLAAERGEHLIADLYAGFERCRGQLDRGRRCARAAASYEEGVAAFYAGDLARAEERLDRVGREVDASIPEPLRRSSRFYRAYARFQLALPGAVEQLEDQLTPRVERRYPSLAGWIHWRLGVAKASLGRNQEARDHYLRGQELIAVGAGGDEAVYAQNLLAEAFDLVGDFERAWRYRLKLFELKAGSGEGRTVHAMLGTAVLGLLAQGELRAAGILLDELVAQNLETGQPEYLAEAYRMRAEHRVRVGDPAGAGDDVEAARELLDGLEESGQREHLARMLDLAQAALLSATDPAEAGRLLSGSLTYFQDAGNTHHQLLTVERRARHLERNGEPERALADWQAAIGMRQRQRKNVEDDSRAVALEAAQVAYDAVLEILLERGGPEDLVEALSRAEQARARYLLDLLGSVAGGDLEPLTAAQIVEGVPAGTVLVEFAVLEGELVAWVVEAGRLRVVRSPIPAERISRLVVTLSSDVEAALPSAVLRRDLSVLYETLIEPLALDLSRVERIVFIPDRDLARVPFAALFDRRERRHLIERVAVARSPSASLFLAPAPAFSRRSGAELVVAAPDLRGTPYPGLPALPGARDEAAALLEIYPSARVLSGGAASAEEFIESLRDARLLHFAGHAVVNADRVLRTELLLAASLDHPGPVTFADLLDRGVLGPPIVVLSACRSADGFTVDREGPLGVAAGFVATGSRSVLASLWKVDDAASSAMLADFHRGLAAGQRASAAWREAVLEQIHRPGSRLETWATFSLYEAVEG